MRAYKTIRALQEGKTVNINGIELKMDEGEIREGDLYVAERNTGHKLLTAKEIVMRPDGLIDFIVPTTLDYPFDGHECVKVREA